MGGHLGKCVSGDFREAAQLPPMYAMVKNREQIVDGPTAAVAEHERPGHMCQGSACVELYGARARDRLKAEDYKGCAEDAGKALWLLDQLENWLASNLDFLKRAADAGADDRGKPKLTKQRSRDDSTLPSHRRRLVHRLERLGREASVGTPKGSPAGRRLMKSLSLGSAKRAYMLREQGESDEERVDEPEKAAGERRTRMRCKLLMLRAAALYYQGEKLDAVQTFEEVLRLDVDCERARGKLVALLRGGDQHLLELLDASRPQVKSPEALPYGGPKTDFRDADANGDESDDEDIEEEVPTLISRCQDVIAAHKELWAPALRTLPLDVMQDLAKRKAVQDTTSNESITTFLSEGTKSLVILHNSKKKKLSREMLEQVPALVPRLEELDLTLSVPLNPATGSMSRFKVGRPEKLEFEPLLSQRFWEELHAHCRGLRRLQVCRDRCTFRSAGEWQAFTRNLATLRSFRLDGCKFETSVDPMLLLRLSPALVHLHLCNLHLPLGDDTFSQLAPNLPLLRQLEIRGCPELSDASLLAVAQHCTSLQSLVVQSHRMSGVGIKAILQACPDLVRVRLGIATIKGAFEGLPVMPHLAEISSCAKTASDMDEASLFAIAGGSCPNLTSLELYACTAATDEVTRQLAQNCPRMRKLSLGFTPTLRGVHLHLFHELRVVKLEMCERLHGPNIRDFIRANTSLEWLSIEHRDRFVQDREAVSLTEDAFDNNAEHFPNFKHLQIKSSHHWAGAQMRPFLLSSPYLETINLIDCPKIRDLPFLGLPENSLRRLTKLHLHQLGISDEGLKALSAAACRLRVIHFCKLDNITEEGLGHLVAEHGMTLRQCLLNVCPQVSKECFRAILAQATRLERLHFWGPSQWLTDEFVERELCAAPCAASLTSLHLCDCEELTLRSVKTILSALPELRSLDLTDSVPGLVKEQARELVVATGNRVQLRGGQSPWKSMARARGGRGVVRGPAAPAALEGTGAGMLVGEGEELRRGSFQAPESW